MEEMPAVSEPGKWKEFSEFLSCGASSGDTRIDIDLQGHPLKVANSSCQELTCIHTAGTSDLSRL